ncbi:MAG: ArsR/SmtB family transcription factor [Gemmatimonadales bacterium]
MRFTDETAEIVAERFQALAEPMRLRILNALRGGERSVSELVEETGAGQANVSKHLQLLHRHGFVDRRKAGVSSIYSISDPSVFDLCDLVCGGVRERLDARRKLLK